MASLNELLGALPSGITVPLSDDAMTKYLRDHYIDNRAETARKDSTRKRVDLYKDKGEKYFEAMIDDKFKNEKNREVRKKFVEMAMYQNLTRRIVREVSAVYSQPANRRVKNDAMNARYKAAQRSVGLDRRMRHGQRMVNLCNESVLWLDLDYSENPKLRIVTPDNFWAVAHPNDPTALIAIIFDKAPPPGVSINATTPRYIVLTDEDHFTLNDSGGLIAGSRKPHGLSRMPAILVHRDEVDTTLLDASPGKDITAAHMALALMNIMLLKHQRSGTRQVVASGDLSDMQTNQQMDEDHILTAPEGVSMTTLDLGADPESYIKTARAIIKQVAANYGIPESVFDLSYQATSGFEIELKRASLKEIRSDQIVDWRLVETELAELMAEMFSEIGSPHSFNLLGWSIDFGETGAPQDPMQRLAYWSELQRLGLMNRIDMYMELNPEATADEAIEAIQMNIDVTAVIVEKQRALNLSMETPADGSDVPSGEDPSEEEEGEE